MQISKIIDALENWAPLDWQESYDNAGLILGNPAADCTGVLCSLDCTEEVVNEAISKHCNLIVSHHPIIFKGVKQLSNDHFVSRVLVKAIQNNIALYAIHTNLDNLLDGVNKTLADRLHLENRRILTPKPGFKDEKGREIGAGLVGELPIQTDEIEFLHGVKQKLNLPLIKYSHFTKKTLKTIALCGGSGSFLINDAKLQNIDCLITSDLKYHDYFEADGKILLLDIGHGQSEQWVASLIVANLKLKFPNFAVLESLVSTEPVHYLKD